jgi:hypothetical protein
VNDIVLDQAGEYRIAPEELVEDLRVALEDVGVPLVRGHRVRERRQAAALEDADRVRELEVDVSHRAGPGTPAMVFHYPAGVRRPLGEVFQYPTQE